MVSTLIMSRKKKKKKENTKRVSFVTNRVQNVEGNRNIPAAIPIVYFELWAVEK